MRRHSEAVLDTVSDRFAETVDGFKRPVARASAPARRTRRLGLAGGGLGDDIVGREEVCFPGREGLPGRGTAALKAGVWSAMGGW